ncbi:DUF2304 domain-containing protein [Cellulomonas sp. WB94]|uniref:DUF2304 domain-containing protein n=1 Tax=Cellulomonas sp. WB94 TaxID=2173174 RepID=UPI000D584557|nr:DUF2304 domain-containing protein [Cellulomonas sp. WB94]PVU82115.1 DUF2304 domain-containing protein [Cellulomonas sp. WB94]
MSGYPFAVALCVVTVGFIVYLLRTRRIREKYAAIWFLVLAAVVVLGAFPGVLFGLARAVGVETPTNLLFASSFVVLLLVCIQLSMEISRLEEETRTIAEEVALLGRRIEVDEQFLRGDIRRGSTDEPTASDNERAT